MRQPRALIPLFATELWERYGFYIVQGLLIFYLIKHFGYSDDRADTLLGEFTALVYISPVLGGWIADRFLGFRYAVALGAILLGVGYAFVATTEPHFFILGLATVIIGNGFLKPNVSSYLGVFYKPIDPKRDAGYTIFYIGINTGIILSTLTSGFIFRDYGPHWAFGTAAVGMLISLISFMLGYRVFGKKGLPTNLNITNKCILGGAIVVGVACACWLLINDHVGQEILIVFGLLVLTGLILLGRCYQRQQRHALYACILLILLSILFWALFFQMFFSINLFTLRSVNRVILGITVPPVAFISIEAIFIILLGGFFAKLWKTLADRNRDFSYPIKFAFAMLAVVVAMSCLIVALHYSHHLGRINPWWIAACYLFLTIGELFISPIGLAMITQLAPPKLVGLLMGVWFMALGFGASFGGYLAEIAAVPHHLSIQSKIDGIYLHAFTVYAIIAGLTFLLTLALTPLIKRLSPY